MVSGNHHEAYIQPVCDQCGKKLEKRYQYTPIKIEAAKESRGVRTSVHEGHLCTECNEVADEDPDECPAAIAEEIVFHFMGSDPARLLMVDILGTHRTGGTLKSIHKYGPEEVPEYLHQLGTALVSCSAGVRSVEYDHDRMDEMRSRYADAERAANPSLFRGK